MRMRCTEATSRLVNQVEMFHHLRGSSNPKRSNCNTCEDTHCVMAVQRLSAVAVQAKQGLEKQTMDSGVVTYTINAKTA